MDTSTEIPNGLPNSSNCSSSTESSPILLDCSIAENLTIGEKTATTNGSTSSGASFSSLLDAQHSMLGEGNDESVENLSDEELQINKEALKSLFLNILQRLDDTDTLIESLTLKLNTANNKIESLTQNLNTANNEIKKLNNKNNIFKNNKN